MSESSGGSHVAPLGVYFGIFFALLCLTGVTVWAATVNFGAWNTPIALGIAVTKALLVVLYFMHLRYSPRFTVLAVTSALVWFVILVGITLSDVYTRVPVRGLPH